MPYAGLDLHKREVEAAILDDAGTLIHRERFPCTREALQAFARTHLSVTHRVAVEATTNTWEVLTILEPFVAEVVVSNPHRTRAIAEAKIKTDRIDAQVLAQLLRCEYLPRVWRPDRPTRQLRQLTTRRATLVASRTAVKNRIHALLHEALIPLPRPQLFSRLGRAWLATLPAEPATRAALDSELRLLAGVERELDLLHATLVQQGHADPRVRLLMTLPGVDVAVAQVLLATLGDVHRFRDGQHAASYLGLVPSTAQSGDHCYHGPITKQGRSHARWLVVQAAQHLDRHPGPLGVFFRRLARRKHRNVAVVATARKLVTIAWRMLRGNEPYRYADPHRTRGKLDRLRVLATACRRRGGIPKGAPRPAAYGSGRATRAVPALDEVYRAAEVPPTPPLAPGERRMLERADLIDFVRDIHTARRIPKRSATPRQGARTMPTPG
jgi:transposase